jgi:uncharacterized protein YjbI with pentapeptide repeats
MNAAGAGLCGPIADAETRSFQQERRRDLSGADLRGATIRHTDLWGADLRGARLGGASFQHVNLEGADLRGAHLAGAMFRQVTLRSIQFGGAKADRASFEFCSMDGLRGARAQLRSARFIDCSAAAADLGGADLENVVFIGCRFENVRLSNARLGGSWSNRTVFDEADLAGASDFAGNRALVVAVLRSAMTGTVAQQLWVGAAATIESRCWDEWRALAKSVPADTLAWARTTFEQFPLSGCAEAMFGDAPTRP